VTDTANNNLYAELNGEPMISALALARLMGVTEAEMTAQMTSQGGNSFRLPAEWIRAGRRRMREYSAHTGQEDIWGAIDWWSARDSS